MEVSLARARGGGLWPQGRRTCRPALSRLVPEQGLLARTERSGPRRLAQALQYGVLVPQARQLDRRDGRPQRAVAGTTAAGRRSCAEMLIASVATFASVGPGRTRPGVLSLAASRSATAAAGSQPLKLSVSLASSILPQTRPAPTGLGLAARVWPGARRAHWGAAVSAKSNHSPCPRRCPWRPARPTAAAAASVRHPGVAVAGGHAAKPTRPSPGRCLATRPRSYGHRWRTKPLHRAAPPPAPPVRWHGNIGRARDQEAHSKARSFFMKSMRGDRSRPQA